MLELNKLYHMDCMEAMREIPDKYFELAIVSYGIKPFGGTLYIREVTRSRFKRRIIRHKHAVNLRNVNSSLSRYLGLIRNCLAKLKNLRIVLYSLFVMVRTAQGINAKIKRFRHISIKQIPHLASIKAHKRKHINFIIRVSLGTTLAATLYIKNVCLTFLCSLRNDTRRDRGFYLNTQKSSAVVHKNIIWESLFARKRYKPFHNKVCANKVLASFANLEFVTKSHNITSYILYHTYYEMSSAKSKVFEAAPQGTSSDPRIHPTQKPVALYEWLLKNYAKQGDKILDTHVGSASSLIACHNMGFDFMGFEIDEDYYRMATERLEAVRAQMRLY